MATQTRSQVLQQIIRMAEAAGYTPAQAAGIAGNAQVESNFNPGAYNSHEGAVGLFQEEGGRLTALKAYAAKTGGSIWDATTQIAFALQEAHQRGNDTQVKATHTASDAAYVWDRKFEVSTTASVPQREADAVAIFNQILHGGPLSAGTSAPITQHPSGGGAGVGTGTLTAAQIAGIQSDIAPGGGWDPLNWPGDIIGGAGDALGSVAGGVLNAAETWITAIVKPVINFFLDAALFFIGFVMIIVGLVVLSKANDDGGTLIQNNGDDSDDDAEEKKEGESKKGGEGGAEADAGDAAVAA